MSARDVPDELLSAYLDDEVTAMERSAVEDALARSPERRARLAELAETRDAVRRLADPDVPAGFLAGLEHAVTAEPRSPAITAARPERARAHRGLTWLAGGVAAAALVAALVIPATDRVDPAVPSRIDTHAARASVSDDPVSELAPIAVATGGLRR
jgi:anti-sigma factor RsiW